MTATHTNDLRGPRNSAAEVSPNIGGPRIASSMEDHSLFIVTFYCCDCSVFTVNGSFLLFIGDASAYLGECQSIVE